MVLEQLLRACLIHVLYGLRSDRVLMEQLHYNLLIRWFVGVDSGDATWNLADFNENRARLRPSRIARRFVNRVLRRAREAGLLCGESFNVDRKILRMWDCPKSRPPIAGPKEASSHPVLPARNGREGNQWLKKTRLRKSLAGDRVHLAGKISAQRLRPGRAGIPGNAPVPAPGWVDESAPSAITQRCEHLANQEAITQISIKKAAEAASSRECGSTTPPLAAGAGESCREMAMTVFRWMKSIASLAKAGHAALRRLHRSLHWMGAATQQAINRR